MMIRVSCLFISDGAFNDDECNVASMFSRNENGGIFWISTVFASNSLEFCMWGNVPPEIPIRYTPRAHTAKAGK